MGTQSYTILLLKETIKSFEEALDREKQVSPYPLAANFGLPGTLFVGRQNQSTPDWVELFNPFLTAPIDKAFTASISAVLLVKYEGRIFALCFGYGKNLLDGSSWIRDFGLKVTLNRVNPAKLRSIDTKTYEDLVVSTRKQTSRSSKVDSFALDVARDLVRGVTGDSQDTTFFKRLAGSDALKCTSELPLTDLGDLLDELLAAYEDSAYKESFGWIDNVKEADPAIQIQLDGSLVQALRAGNGGGMHLAPSDVVEWEDITGFNFTGGRKAISYPELALENYLEVLAEKRGELSLDQIKRHKVRVRYEDAEVFRDQWSVYDCVVWEAKLGAKRYVLFDGRWFEINQDYATQVMTYVNSITATSVGLPEATLGDDEGEYNAGVANSEPKKFALLDRQTIRPTGAASPIEFCDLMSKAGHLIHVKKRSSSATMSHLFSQGSVSCDVFLADPTVRREVRAKLRKMGKASHAKLIPKQRPTPSEFEVVYAVLAKDGGSWPPELPFFSAVNLMHHAKRIQNLGFKVSLQHVKQV